MARYFAESALLADGWAEAVLFDVDELGFIAGIHTDLEPDADTEKLSGSVIPGLTNAHCHSCLRAVAGRPDAFATHSGALHTWRTKANALLNDLGPDEIEAIHAQAYLEMVKLGFTNVGEVQSIFRTPHGQHYADTTEISQRIIAAAHQVGIRLTLLPALDRAGEAGMRGRLDVDDLLAMTGSLHAQFGDEANLRIGLAVCSLPAVGPEHLAMAVAGKQAQYEMAPIHLSLAADLRDTTEIGMLLDDRLVDWLLSETPIDGRWCLVHASQITPEEATQLASSDAVIALCPIFSSALNLAPFPMAAYLAVGGNLAIGAGAPLTASPFEEIRALMVRYRLMAKGPDLFSRLVSGGGQATGSVETGLATGLPADWLVLDRDHPSLLDAESDAILQSLVFSGGANPVRDVMIGGEWVIRDGYHAEEEPVLDAYRDAINQIEP
ncbi:MAG: amidohydrolase family protein [Pseudomonadota bacterium]